MAVGDDFFHYRNSGTAGGFGKRWYPTAFLGSFWYGHEVAAPNGSLHATAFHSGRGVTIAEIGTYFGTGTATKVRFGLYNLTTQTGNFYPSSLRIDFGEADVTASSFVKLTGSPLPYAVPANTLFAAVVTTNGNNNVTAAAVASAGVKTYAPALSSNDLNAVRNGVTVASTYGALPDPYPTGGVSTYAVASPWMYFSAVTYQFATGAVITLGQAAKTVT